MYHKIMVPLDGSELAECVLPHVEAIARGCGVGSVVLVRVVGPVQIPVELDSAVSHEKMEQFETGAKPIAEGYLDKVVSRIKGEGLDVRSEVIAATIPGAAAEILADYAEKNAVDLIVMATHGRSGISRWAWGSVAERVLRSAHIPVLLIRAPGCVPGIG